LVLFPQVRLLWDQRLPGLATRPLFTCPNGVSTWASLPRPSPLCSQLLKNTLHNLHSTVIPDNLLFVFYIYFNYSISLILPARLQLKEKVLVLKCISCVPPDHLFLDSAPNLGPLISRWEIIKFENCCYKSVRILEVLKLLLQQFLNLSSSQQDMSGPRLGDLSKNRWSGGTVQCIFRSHAELSDGWFWIFMPFENEIWFCVSSGICFFLRFGIRTPQPHNLGQFQLPYSQTTLWQLSAKKC
jgi:hypothetical protein